VAGCGRQVPCWKAGMPSMFVEVQEVQTGIQRIARAGAGIIWVWAAALEQGPRTCTSPVSN
jgi:hypothetical protein